VYNVCALGGRHVYSGDGCVTGHNESTCGADALVLRGLMRARVPACICAFEFTSSGRGDYFA